MKQNERVQRFETQDALNTLQQHCCPQEIKKQFREMKWVKWAVTETKSCGSTSKSVTASCAWDFQPLRVGGKPPNKFQRIFTECFLWKSEDIYITCSTPLISGAKTEQHSVVSCFKRVIFYHIFKNTIKCFSRRWSNSLKQNWKAQIFLQWTLKFLCSASSYWWLTAIAFFPLRIPG